jgi:hypothetical protein
MKEHSAISSRIRKLWPFVAVLTGLMLSSALLMFGTAADNGSDARYNDLGHRLVLWATPSSHSRSDSAVGWPSWSCWRFCF